MNERCFYLATKKEKYLPGTLTKTKLFLKLVMEIIFNKKGNE